MDNYKIKVKDEAESKEAQELFFELGYIVVNHVDNEKGFIVVSKEADSPFNFGYWCSVDKELTIPQLRDLVVLKRNDVKDANHTYIGGGMVYKTCEDICYLWSRTGWEYKGIAHNLVPIQKHLESATGRFDENGEHHLTFSKGAEEKDPALISGADALRALADGKGVDVHESTYKNEVWFNLKDTKFTPAEILAEKVRDKPYKLSFRLKPQTIKLELELPKPFEPKVGDIYWFLSPFYSTGYDHCTFTNDSSDKLHVQYGAYRSEDDVKKAVEQLRKIRGAS
ncbi:TPA: hypothetical protein JI063_17875 [Acinetobacter baumannii]|nr:hypothetical protein [Acinetobacter baumannii]